MKSILLIIIILSFSIFSFGCSKEGKETIWDPPITGLTWGMSMDEVKEMLDFESTAISEQNNITYLSINEKCNTIYGIEMVFTLSFDKDMELYRFEGTCDESNIPDLKDKLEEKYEAYLSGQQPSYGIRWDTERVIDRKDYKKLMNHLSERFGNLPEYDSLKEGFQYSPLIYVELIETGGRIGTLIVDGDTQVQVDNLLSD